MKKNIIIISIIVLVVVAGGSFYGGTMYGKTQTPKLGYTSGTFQTRINRGGGAGLISGTILSKDASSVTLQLQNNSGSKIILYSDSTQINKYAAGTANDLATGTTISVTGTTNSDGSVTAQSIQIRPAGQNRSTGVAPAQ